MKIVIDVDTDNPIHHAEGTDYFMPDLHAFISENMLKILKESCKVLPKGHGRLIDADVVLEVLNNRANRDYRRTTGSIMDAIKIIQSDDYIPTIVEAESEENQNGQS